MPVLHLISVILTLFGIKVMMNKSFRNLMKDLLPLTATMMFRRAILPTNERLTNFLATGPRAIPVQSYDFWPALHWLLSLTISHYLPAAPQHIFHQTESTGHISLNYLGIRRRLGVIIGEAGALWSLIRVKLNIIAGRSADYIACLKQ